MKKPKFPYKVKLDSKPADTWVVRGPGIAPGNKHDTTYCDKQSAIDAVELLHIAINYGFNQKS